MKVYKLIYILIALISCKSEYRHDVLFDDFEKNSFEHWETQGVTFYKPVHKDSISFQLQNVHGRFVAISNYRSKTDELKQGKLISKPITINRKYITFLIAGGKHDTRECINLMVHNRVVRTATGNNDNTLRFVSWDVSDIEGESAVIEVLDAIEGNWGNCLDYVIVDNIVFTDKNHKNEVMFEDFESGTFNNWTVTGEAFIEPGNRRNIYYPLSANGYNGRYFAFSFGETHDLKTGKLRSEPFQVRHDNISFLIGGGDHPLETCINLIINDSIIKTATGRNSEKMRPEKWDVTPFKGKTATLEILDAYSGGWGHIMIDDIKFSDNKKLISINHIITYSITILIIIITFSILWIYFRKRKKTSLITTDPETQELYSEITEKIISEKMFLKKGLTIKEVASGFNIPTNDFAELFEKASNENFFDFINRYRVEEFKTEINKDENRNFTMLYVAQMCGFSSKSSFYRIFKSFTGETPSQYCKQNIRK